MNRDWKEGKYNKVGKKFHDVITTTGTCVVCDCVLSYAVQLQGNYQGTG